MVMQANFHMRAMTTAIALPLLNQEFMEAGAFVDYIEKP